MCIYWCPSLEEIMRSKIDAVRFKSNNISKIFSLWSTKVIRYDTETWVHKREYLTSWCLVMHKHLEQPVWSFPPKCFHQAFVVKEVRLFLHGLKIYRSHVLRYCKMRNDFGKLCCLNDFFERNRFIYVNEVLKTRVCRWFNLQY